MGAKEKLGERVRDLREERGLSQRRLALMIGIDKTYLCGIERGSRNPTLATLEKIADGLGIPLAELFAGV